MRVCFIPGGPETSLIRVMSRLSGCAIYEKAHLKEVNGQTVTDDSRYLIEGHLVPIRIVSSLPGCLDQFSREIGSLVSSGKIKVVSQMA